MSLQLIADTMNNAWYRGGDVVDASLSSIIRATEDVKSRGPDAQPLSNIADGTYTPDDRLRHEKPADEMTEIVGRISKDAEDALRKRVKSDRMGFDADFLTSKFVGEWTILMGRPHTATVVLDGKTRILNNVLMEDILTNAMKFTIDRLKGNWEFISIEGVTPEIDETGTLTGKPSISSEVRIHPQPITTFPDHLWLLHSPEGSEPLDGFAGIDGFTKLFELHRLYYSYAQVPEEYKTGPLRTISEIVHFPEDTARLNVTPDQLERCKRVVVSEETATVLNGQTVTAIETDGRTMLMRIGKMNLRADF